MPVKIAPQKFDVTVTKIKDFGNETRHFELSFDSGKFMDFLPGQFLSVLCPDNGKVIRRAYSIASHPGQQSHLDLIIKLVDGGKVTNWFWTFHEGERIKVDGPFGKFLLPDEIKHDLVFVATGTGIAPFRSMIKEILPKGFNRKIWLVFGARYDNMIPYHDEWLKLASNYPRFNYVPTISRPGKEWKGETGYVQTKISSLFRDTEGKLVYICGLNDMIQAVQDACLAQGFHKENIHFERYD